MGKTKHEKTFVDYDKPYETNLIGLRGIVYFGVGLFLLIVITFALMWALENTMEDFAKEDKDKVNPMMIQSAQDRLPPEPRLQAAPGFGVDGERGRVNLELAAPQSEWWELQKLWQKEWREGQKDEKTGTVVTLPIEEAKTKLISESGNQANTADGQKILEESQRFVSYSSAGRTASDRRR